MKRNLLSPLSRAANTALAGGKAANLAAMARAGLQVPPGSVLDTRVMQDQLLHLGIADKAASLLECLGLNEPDMEQVCRQAEEIRQQLRGNALFPDLAAELQTCLEPSIVYAVRSSAPGEDGSDLSFAGQFESVLGCRSAEEAGQAICTVWASLFSERAILYAINRHHHLSGMAVIIQQQVNALYSGVMFTRDPRNRRSNALVVEYCAGLGEQLVSGQLTPRRLCIDRDSGEVVEESVPEGVIGSMSSPEAVCTSLLQVSRQLESLFGEGQDVEWSVDPEGKLWLLQSRPITAISVSKVEVWSNANIAENFPDPVCPLLRSFVSRGYAAYFRGLGHAFGIADSRMAAMSHALDNLVGCQAGRLYYNLTNIHTVLNLAPLGSWLARFFNQFTGASEFPEPEKIHRNRVAEFMELALVAVHVLFVYLGVGRRVARFETRVDDYAQASEPYALEGRTPSGLAELLRGFLRIRLEQWTDPALADTAAMVCYGVLQAMMKDHAGIDPNHLLKGLPGLASAIPVEKLWELSRLARTESGLKSLIESSPPEEVLMRLQEGEFPDFAKVLDTWFTTWGFRSSGELMLSRPTPAEDPLSVIKLLRNYVETEGEGPAEISRRQAEDRMQATRLAVSELDFCKGVFFRLVLKATQESIRLRERARMKQALLYTRLRLVALALGRKLVDGHHLDRADDILFLGMEEALTLAEGQRIDGIIDMVIQRRNELDACMALDPPDSLVLSPGEQWRPHTTADESGREGSRPVLAGTGACGGKATGPAAVVVDVSEIDRIIRNQILVTRQTDPGWAVVFFLVSGLVIERGGLLSHGAIIAREYGIPAVVGVRDATRLIRDGQVITVDGDRQEVLCDQD